MTDLQLVCLAPLHCWESEGDFGKNAGSSASWTVESRTGGIPNRNIQVYATDQKQI